MHGDYIHNDNEDGDTKNRIGGNVKITSTPSSSDLLVIHNDPFFILLYFKKFLQNHKL